MSNLITGSLEKNIKTFINEKKNRDLFIKVVRGYIDRNNEVLYHNTPTYRLYFSDNDRGKMYDFVDIEVSTINELMSRLEHIDKNWKIANDPFNVLMTMIIREFTIKKDKDGVANGLLYLTMSLYASLHYKFFKYPPNDNVMQYTINNISNRYLFKQYGILLKALYHTAESSHETYKNLLIKSDDKSITEYFINLRSRLNNLLRNFADEYHTNYKEGNYLNTQEDSNEEDDYCETENLSGLIYQLSEKVNIKFFSSSISNQLVRLACQSSSCDTPTLHNAIQNIKEQESDKVIDLIRLIIQVYLSEPNNSYESLNTKKFIGYSLTVYAKSNTKNESILEIKQLLDYFLNKNCERYMKTEREATKVNYRKGLYVFFVLLISDTQVSK